MTQRDAPPLPVGLEDEEEERTTVGAPPDPAPHAPHAPSKVAPPRVPFTKHNTPTAFPPHNQQQPPQQHHHQHQPLATPDRPPALQPSPDQGAPAPVSQAHPRPTLGVGSIPPVPDRGSSGPQQLPPTPTRGPGPAAPPPHPMGVPQPNPNSMMFGPPPQQRDMSFAGPPPNGPLAQAQQSPPMGSGMTSTGQSLGFRPDAAPREGRSAPFAVMRSRAFSLVLDARGQPVELGSGRVAKVYLGEERGRASKPCSARTPAT